LLRGEVTRLDAENGTITVILDGVSSSHPAIRWGQRNTIEASASPGEASKSTRRKQHQPD
jgi:hypothetical protein